MRVCVCVRTPHPSSATALHLSLGDSTASSVRCFFSNLSKAEKQHFVFKAKDSDRCDQLNHEISHICNTKRNLKLLQWS